MNNFPAPLLSVICPVRNMEGKLLNLSSWISQIGTMVEVILVYDDSSDNTYSELVKTISGSTKKNQITLVSGKFGNPGSARNAGLKIAKADWVCFWDSDDLGFPDVVTDVLLDRHQNDLTQVYCFGYEQVSREGTLEKWAAWKESTDSNLSSVSLNPGLWRFCFRRELSQSREFSRLKMGEDQLYLVQVGLGNISVRFENGIAYRYFKNVDGQLTSTYSALIDLGASITALANEQGMGVNKNQFATRLLIRQAMTALKIPNTKLQSKALRILFIQLIRNPKIVLTQIYQIVRSRKVD